MGLREVNRVRRRVIGILSACFILLFLGRADFILHFLGVAQAPLTDYYISLNVTNSPDRTYLIYTRNPEFGSAVTGFIHYSNDGTEWSGPVELPFNPGAAQVVGDELYAVRQRDFSAFGLKELLGGSEKAWKSSGAFEGFKWPVLLSLGADEGIRLIGFEMAKGDKVRVREAVLADGVARELDGSIEIQKPDEAAVCECRGYLHLFYSLPGENKVRLMRRKPGGEWEDRGELPAELGCFACACFGDVVHIVGTPGGDAPVDASLLVHYRLGIDGSFDGPAEFHHGIETFLGQRRRAGEVALSPRGESMILAARLGSVIATAVFDHGTWSSFSRLNGMPFATKAIMWTWLGGILALSLALVWSGFQLYLAKRGKLRSAPEREAVPVELPGMLRRFAAFAVDFAVISLLAFTLVQPSSIIGGGRSLLDAIDMHHPLAIAAIFLVYFSLPEALFGQTPGKALLGVIVKGEDGRKAGVWAVVLRNLFKLHEFLLIVETFVLISTEKGRRLGDLAAGTVVAKKPPQEDK